MRIVPLLGALLLAAPAFGQATSALKNHDTRAPVDIDAARVEVRDKDNQAIFSGNVHAVQGNMKLDSPTLRVFYEKRAGADPEIQRIDAQGGVTLTSPSETARGSYGVYDVNNRQITMIGDVVLNQGSSVLRGQRLVIDLETGRSSLDGASGAAAPGQGGGRVTGRFVVPQRRTNP